MNFSIKRTGDWKRVGDILGNLGMNAARAFELATAQEAHFFERKLKEGMQSGAPGGRPYAPLSPLTLAIRKFEGFNGKKPLIHSGAMLRSIHVVKRGALYFVGIDRGAKTDDGESVMDIAELHENGASFAMEVTPAARRFLAMVMRDAGLIGQGSSGGGGGAQIAVVHIPARPTFGPVMEMYGKPDEVRQRFEDRVLRILWGIHPRHSKPVAAKPGEEGGSLFGGLFAGLFGKKKKKGGPERDPQTGRFLPKGQRPGGGGNGGRDPRTGRFMPRG